MCYGVLRPAVQHAPLTFIKIFLSTLHIHSTRMKESSWKVELKREIKGYREERGRSECMGGLEWHRTMDAYCVIVRPRKEKQRI